LRISARTNSHFVSQKSARRPRSSSGVNRSEEKIVVGANAPSYVSVDSVLLFVFIAVFPYC
jgi:hypothetical protein